MVRSMGVVFLLLCGAGTAHASPTIDLHFASRSAFETRIFRDEIARASRLDPVDVSLEGGVSTQVAEALSAPAHYRGRSEVGRGIVNWLLTASFFGVCLTAGAPDLIDGDPQLIAMTLGSPTALEQLVIPDWASGIARAIGVATFELGGESSTSSTGHTASVGRVHVTLLPIGPEHAAGLSITGSYR